MALIIRKIFNIHDYALREWGDPRLDGWFLMGSAWPVLTIVSLYLYVVLNLGPKFMENRKPYNINSILILYNAIQIIYCGACAVLASIYIIPYYNIFCEPIDFSMSFRGIFAAKLTWAYLIIKVIDLLDTIFFVLKKNNNHISFLHVYHHVMILITAWINAQFASGGTGFYLIYYNSITHTVMYGYYLITVLDKSYRKNQGLKRHITHIQLLQFSILLVQCVTTLILNDCRYPKWPLVPALPQILFMLYMFGDFYSRTYILSPKIKKNYEIIKIN